MVQGLFKSEAKDEGAGLFADAGFLLETNAKQT